MLSWLEQVRDQNYSGHSSHSHGSHDYNGNVSNDSASKSNSINNPSEISSPLSNDRNDRNKDDNDDNTSDAASITLSRSRSRSKIPWAQSNLSSNIAEATSNTRTTALATLAETSNSAPAIAQDTIALPATVKPKPPLRSRTPTASTSASTTASTSTTAITATRASASLPHPQSSRNPKNSSAPISRLFKSKRMSSNGPNANSNHKRSVSGGSSNHSLATVGGESTRIMPSLTYTDFLEHQFKEQLRKDKERMLAAKLKANNNNSSSNNKNANNSSNNDGSSNSNDGTALVGGETKPRKWSKVVDPEGDVTFYMNNETNEMQFNPPPDFVDDPAAIGDRIQQQQQQQQQERMHSPTFAFVEELLLGANNSTAANSLLLSPSSSLLFKQPSQSLTQRNALNAATMIKTRDLFSDTSPPLHGGDGGLVAQQQMQHQQPQTQILTPSPSVISSSTDGMFLSSGSLDAAATGSVTKVQVNSGDRMGAIMAQLHEMKIWFDESVEMDTLAESRDGSVRNFLDDIGYEVTTEGGDGDDDSQNNADEDFSKIDSVTDINDNRDYRVVAVSSVGDNARVDGSGTDGGGDVGKVKRKSFVFQDNNLAEYAALFPEPIIQQQIQGEVYPQRQLTPQQLILEQQRHLQQSQQQSSSSSTSPLSIANSFILKQASYEYPQQVKNDQMANPDAYFSGVSNSNNFNNSSTSLSRNDSTVQRSSIVGSSSVATSSASNNGDDESLGAGGTSQRGFFSVEKLNRYFRGSSVGSESSLVGGLRRRGSLNGDGASVLSRRSSGDRSSGSVGGIAGLSERLKKKK
ncbi:hypothetical protein HK100_005036 [Physocladia obscura]|uniref:WW domain-containing protein n=1 Tax=Physocladia obscura TaxID=109957 RepID=A0AAD5XIE0_9FUNG|nr:hypothetical protein HK100_005036 [Physocladia obscura]